jgi:ATP-dependent Lon protease
MKKILIVDDEDLILLALSAALRQNGACVKTVSCGKDALAEIDRAFYDLCFLDIHLPDANGLELMKTVREASPATNIVMMSGDTLDDDAKKTMLKTARYFLPKPFDLEQVRSLAHGLLREERGGTDHAATRSYPDNREGSSNVIN